MTAGRPDTQFRAALQRLRAALGQDLCDEVGLLPGERELSARLDISRTTLRRVLAALVDEGALVQRQGVGTFLASAGSRTTASPRRPAGLNGLAATAASRGLDLRSRLLSRTEALPLPEEAMLLACPPGELVHRLRRLRSLEGVPVAIEDAVVPAALWPSPAEVGASLHLALAQGGLVLERRLQSVRATGADADEARLLGVGEASPVIRLRRTEYSTAGRCGLFTRTVFRADSFDLLVDMAGPSTSGPSR